MRSFPTKWFCRNSSSVALKIPGASSGVSSKCKAPLIFISAREPRPSWAGMHSLCIFTAVCTDRTASDKQESQRPDCGSHCDMFCRPPRQPLISLGLPGGALHRGHDRIHTVRLSVGAFYPVQENPRGHDNPRHDRPHTPGRTRIPSSPASRRRRRGG